MDGDSATVLEIVTLIVFLAISALASAAETSLTSLGRARLRHLRAQGVKRADSVDRLLSDPNYMLSAILVVNSVAIVGAASIATLLVARWLGFDRALPVVLIGLSLVVLVFTEAIPKALAAGAVERGALVVARPVEALTAILMPFLKLLSAFTNAVLRLFGRPPVGTALLKTEEELRTLLAVGEDIEDDEREMIHAVLDLEDTTVHQIMVPRLDVTAAPADATGAELAQLIVRTGYSRIPIYEGSIDSIVGMVYAKDLLRYFASGEPVPDARAIARPGYFVPETKRVDDLLREMQQQRFQICVVVDEFGGTAGIVTVEDLVEEIVGEIRDEYDVEEAPLVQISESEVVADARVSIDEINDLLDAEIDDAEVDTVGGFLLNRLNKIPSVGDQVRVDGLVISVLSTNGRRIKKVQIARVATRNQASSA